MSFNKKLIVKLLLDGIVTLLVGLPFFLNPLYVIGSPRSFNLVQQLMMLNSVDLSSVKISGQRKLLFDGLKTKPRPKSTVKMPAYMYQLYQDFVRQDDDEIEPDKTTASGKAARNSRSSSKPSNNRIAVTGSPNTIRSHEFRETGEKQLSHGKNHVILKFDVNLPEGEQLLGAELRLYIPSNMDQSKNIKVKQELADDEKSSSLQDLKKLKIRIALYDILSDTRDLVEEMPIEDQLILRLIDTHIVNISDANWLQLDVFPAVERWIKHPQQNHGLFLSLSDLNGGPLDGTIGDEFIFKSIFHRHQLENQEPLLSTRDKLSSQEQERYSYRIDDENNWDKDVLDSPFLITYASDQANDQTKVLNRMKRLVRNGRKHRRKGKRETCRRNSLYVDFADVGWSDWIVAPIGYHAYFCHGDCPYPVSDHQNSTNHAIVQTLVNSVSPNKVPKACCVPTELSSISMLYLDDYEKVVLKNYQDMVVEACGCR